MELLSAVESVNLNEARRLLKDAACDIEKETDKGLSALQLAVTKGALELVEALIEGGANIAKLVPETKYSCLHLLCQSMGSDVTKQSNISIFKLLLRKPLHVNITCFDGTTPLHIAAQNNNTLLVKTLLQNGADVSLKTNNEKTAFDLTTDRAIQIMLSSRSRLSELSRHIDSNLKGRLPSFSLPSDLADLSSRFGLMNRTQQWEVLSKMVDSMDEMLLDKLDILLHTRRRSLSGSSDWDKPTDHIPCPTTNTTDSRSHDSHSPSSPCSSAVSCLSTASGGAEHLCTGSCQRCCYAVTIPSHSPTTVSTPYSSIPLIVTDESYICPDDYTLSSVQAFLIGLPATIQREAETCPIFLEPSNFREISCSNFLPQASPSSSSCSCSSNPSQPSSANSSPILSSPTPTSTASATLNQSFSAELYDYAPQVFRSLRRHFSVKDVDYVHSITGPLGLRQIRSTGRSGSLFFQTADKKLLIKLISEYEADVLVGLLEDYFVHMCREPNSLLPWFYGLYKVTMNKSRTAVYILVMRNIFDVDKPIHERYDLKGSTVQRSATSQERQHAEAVLKDLDFSRRLFVSTDVKSSLLSQLDRDLALLLKNNIMDYSFLVGIHSEDCSSDLEGRMHRVSSSGSEQWIYVNGNHQTSTREPVDSMWIQGIPSTTANEIYYFGVIDTLQTYDTWKFGERVIKALWNPRKMDQISAVNPITYFQRFRQYIDSITDTGSTSVQVDSITT
eukprot:GILJ01009523.1.p1 GENE.GILJ01009523.1~~GILJ01009523.1.p1  ORF type:complete len:731 (+),score=86.70 GILJ01009523.1:165-2357(+)